MEKLHQGKLALQLSEAVKVKLGPLSLLGFYFIFYFHVYLSSMVFPIEDLSLLSNGYSGANCCDNLRTTHIFFQAQERAGRVIAPPFWTVGILVDWISPKSSLHKKIMSHVINFID